MAFVPDEFMFQQKRAPGKPREYSMNGNRRELKKMLRKVIHAWTPPFRDSPTGNPWASRARNTWPLVSRGKDSMTRTPSRRSNADPRIGG